MRIQLTRNLGKEWPEPWREGEIHDAMDTIADRLIAKGFAVRLPDEPAPVPAQETVIEAVPAVETPTPRWGRRRDRSTEG